MKKNFLRLNIFCGVAFLAFCLCAAAADGPGRTRISLDTDWRFHAGDAPGTGKTLRYEKIQQWLLPSAAPFQILHTNAPPSGRPPGEKIPFAQPGFDDTAWRRLNLPHDWGVEGDFDQKLPGETAKLNWWGAAWYRRALDLPAADAGRRIFLDVDGAMAYASVWINGRFAGGWPFGYASWQLELTPFVNFGGTNVVAIRLDNPPASSRWYPGGGIYRHVWLEKTAPLHVAHWGTCLTTPEVSENSATVKLCVTVQNESAASAVAEVTTKIFALDAAGEKSADAVAEFSSITTNVPARGATAASVSAVLQHPKLWSTESPARYVAVTSVSSGGAVCDAYETPFGVRTIQFTTDNGFLLNGKRVAIHGVCLHHDLGPLGSALNDRALERQIDLLQEMGCNAVRTSHNPPSPELLDLCDRRGLLVMDEAFDCWVAAKGKNKNAYNVLFPKWHEADLRAQLRRDRNHPSVILWSIGNEISEQTNRPAGHRVALELAAIAHNEDPTRPVTAASNHTEAGYNGFQHIVDVFGYNYHPDKYAAFRATNAAVPVFGSETASTVSSRGEYFFPLGTNQKPARIDFQVSSYDLSAPAWATTPDKEFSEQDSNPFVAGEFVWTGFDYLGEPTPYWSDTTNKLIFTDPAAAARAEEQKKKFGKARVPSRSSYFGILDLCGFKKDRYYIYQAHWRPDFPMAHILPHWNWPERVGEITPVHIYTSGDEAELFLNGQSLGRKMKIPGEYRLRWDDVKYAPGELKAVAYKNGHEWATDVMKTAGAPAKLKVAADRQTIRADGRDLSFVTVTIADKDGGLVPRTKNLVHFKISGPGEIVGVDSGNPASHERMQALQHTAFNGLCLAVVRSRAGEPGEIIIKATSEGLAGAEITIQSAGR